MGPFLDNFGFPSFTGLFMRDDDYLGWSIEVVDILKLEIMNLDYIIIQVQYDINYPLGFGEPTNSVDLCVFPWV